MTDKQLFDDFIAPVCHQQIDVLYKDDSILVINKPSGLLSLSGKNPLNNDSVHHRLRQEYVDINMVHRLDFGTSGVMVLAFDKQVNAHLTKQFQARSVLKKYQAVLLGHLVNDHGVIDLPLAKAMFPYQKVCNENGKPATSAYSVLERFNESINGVKLSHVEFTPETGRTHQLRVHSLEIGHPIIGCDLYNADVDGVDSKSLAKRLMLHAQSLEFVHPETNQKVEFSCAFDGEL